MLRTSAILPKLITMCYSKRCELRPQSMKAIVILTYTLAQYKSILSYSDYGTDKLASIEFSKTLGTTVATVADPSEAEPRQCPHVFY
jgi:hypothetical protein